MKNIVEIMREVPVMYPEKTAIADKKGSLSFSELEEQMLRTARYFLASGIQRGDSVLVFVPLSIDLYRVTLALNYIGATAVFVEDWLALKKLSWCCKVSEATAMVTTSKLKRFSFLWKGLRAINLKVKHEGFGKYEALEVPPYDNPDAIALKSFTTGSSGIPKMLSRSFDFLTHQFYTLSTLKGLKKDDVELLTLPVFLFLNLAAGITSVIADFSLMKGDKVDAVKIEKQMADWKVNSLCSSPAFLKKLASGSRKKELYQNIEKITTGGSPVFPNDAALLKASYPNAEIKVLYGASEAEPISTTSAEILQGKSVQEMGGLYTGAVHENIELAFLAIGTTNGPKAFVEASRNRPGEICVRGSNVLFDKDLSKDRNKIEVDGTWWHCTGDTGFCDAEGKLILTGPVNALIELNMRYYSPFLFEGVCKTIAGIRHATILKQDKEILAVVETQKNADPMQIRGAIKETGFGIDKVIFIRKMPMDPRHRGKIDYGKLRAKVL